MKKATDAVETTVNNDLYFKDSILKSNRYSNRRDALSFLLEKDKPYTLEQVDMILDEYMKGQVK